MKRNFLSVLFICSSLFWSCGTNDEEKTEDKAETKQVEVDRPKEIIGENASDPAILKKVERMLEELEVAVDNYCKCMETAEKSADCRREYAKLSAGLEEEDANRLSNDDKIDFLSRASKIMEPSKACDKEFN